MSVFEYAIYSSSVMAIIPQLVLNELTSFLTIFSSESVFIFE